MVIAAELLQQVKRSHERFGGTTELAHYAKEGEKVAFGYIDRTYGKGVSNRDNVLFYHGVENWHSKGVDARVDRITEAMGLSPRDRLLAKVAADFHDTVQNWDRVTTLWPDERGHLTAVNRKRFTGVNEEMSAAFARRYMVRANKVAGHDVFVQDDMRVVTDAIMLTVPKGWNGKTVFNPGFGTAGLIAQAVQLADLGGGGMNGPQMALYEALTLFPEENMDFRADADTILGASRRSPVTISSEQLGMYKARLVNWIQRQQVFVEGRKERLRAKADDGGEIALLPEHVREKVGALFKDEYFDKSIQSLKDLEAKYTAMSPAALPKELFGAIKTPPTLSW